MNCNGHAIKTTTSVVGIILLFSFEIPSARAVLPRTTGRPTERHAGFVVCHVTNALTQRVDVLHPTGHQTSGQKSRCHVGVQPRRLTEPPLRPQTVHTAVEREMNPAMASCAPRGPLCPHTTAAGLVAVLAAARMLVAAEIHAGRTRDPRRGALPKARNHTILPSEKLTTMNMNVRWNASPLPRPPGRRQIAGG